MNSFDDLLNEQLLNELGDGGVIDSIGTAVSRKVGGFGDKIKAKLGSKAAVGRNNLRDKMHYLVDEFQVYASEQHITVAEAAVEDFLEFLRHRVGFNITDENFDGLAYGNIAKEETPHKANIEGMGHDLGNLLHQHDLKGAQSHIDELARIASGNTPDGMLARKELWKAARAYPSLKQVFNHVRQYVGRPLRPKFPELCLKIAQVMIKLGGKAAQAGESGKRTSVADSNDLEPGLVPALSTGGFTSQGIHYRPLLEQLEAYGFSLSMFDKIHEKLRDGGSPEEINKLVQMVRPYSKNKIINLCRILLQCFRSPNNKPLEAMLAANYAGSGKLPAAVHTIITMSLTDSEEKDDKGRSLKVYDGSRVNRLLADNLTDDASADKFLVALVGLCGR